MNYISHNNWSSMSDAALLETIGKFVKHHRLNQNKSQSEVADAAGISRSTLSLMERGEKTVLSSLLKVLRVLDVLNVMAAFSVSDEISPIEYAKLQKNKRQRASGKSTETTNDDLGW